MSVWIMLVMICPSLNGEPSCLTSIVPGHFTSEQSCKEIGALMKDRRAQLPLCSALGKQGLIACPKLHVSSMFALPPNSRHVQRISPCPLSANSGHTAIHSITSSDQHQNDYAERLHLLIANSRSVSALPQRSTIRELDLQPLGCETRQKWAGINDLLRHPGARFGNIALDQQSRHSCSSRGCRVRLGVTEKCRSPRATAVPDIHAERELSVLAGRTIPELPCHGMTDSFDRHEARGAGTNHHCKTPCQPRRFNGESCKCCPSTHRARIKYLVRKRKKVCKLRSCWRWKFD